MRRPVAIAALFALNALLVGCCMPDGLVGLQPGEREGVRALITTIGEYGAETGDERAQRIHAELAACLEDGRFLRGDCEGEYILGRTCDDLVCLDTDVPYDIDRLRRDPTACMLALAILYHEGVHLEQSLGDYLFSDHEKDAYLTTHVMQRWIAAETAARVAPLPDVTFGPEEVFAALEEVRSGMGQDYLAEICPATSRRQRLMDWVGEHIRSDLAWLEVPPRAYEVVVREDGLLEAEIDLAVVRGKLGPRVKTTYLGRKEGGQAPTWSTPRLMIESAADVEFAIGWYLARRGEGPDQGDDWNREKIGPASFRFDDQNLVLVLTPPLGEGEPKIAFALSVLVRLPARAETPTP